MFLCRRIIVLLITLWMITVIRSKCDRRPIKRHYTVLHLHPTRPLGDVAWLNMTMVISVIILKCFLPYRPFMWIPVDSPRKGQAGHLSLVDSHHKGSVMRSIDIFVVFSLNELSNKQSNCGWFETPWRSCDTKVMSINVTVQHCAAPRPIGSYLQLE